MTGAAYLAPNPAVDALVVDIGALLVGRRTFDGDDPYRGTEAEGQPFGGAWSAPHFVLTHHAPETPAPGVTFVGDLGAAIAAAGTAAGDRYVNVLGADVARLEPPGRHLRAAGGQPLVSHQQRSVRRQP